jgi:5'-nucleotidase
MASFTKIPRILLTNDDGIDAPGMAVLIDIAQELSDDVWVIAPEHDKSGTGQSLSLHHPLRCQPRGGKNCWAVSGTPADCVAIAMSHYMVGNLPSLILSGVNAGSNMGDDVNLSGTLGAAFTGLMLGVKSIAISQSCESRKLARWDTARAVVPKVLRAVLGGDAWPPDTCLSLNIPDRPAAEVTGFSWARQGFKTIAHIRTEARVDMRDEKYYWLSLHDRDEPPRSDYDSAILARGHVAVTPLVLDRSREVKAPPVNFADLK